MILIYVSVFNLLLYDVLVKLDEENYTSHRCIVGKGWSILIVFSNNCGYFSLMLHQKLTNGNFLKVSCHAESKTISMTFSYSVTLKCIGLLCVLNGSITKAWFFKSMIGYLENIDLLSYTDLQNGDTFHFTMSKKFTC